MDRTNTLMRMLISLLALGLIASACSNSTSDSSQPATESEQTTTSLAANNDSSPPENTAASGETARITVAGVVSEYSGSCTNLENLGRATWFGTATGPNGESLEMSVAYTYPDGDFEASAGFTVLVTEDGSIFVESNGLREASLEDGVISIESVLQGTSIDGQVEGTLEIECGG